MSSSVSQEEQEEGGACGGGVVKMEEGGVEGFSSPSPLQGGGKDGDGGKELLRHLLKDKTSPATTPSPTAQATPTARRQLSNESVRSEEEDRPGSHSNVVRRGGVEGCGLVACWCRTDPVLLSSSR